MQYPIYELRNGILICIENAINTKQHAILRVWDSCGMWKGEVHFQDRGERCKIEGKEICFIGNKLAFCNEQNQY